MVSLAPPQFSFSNSLINHYFFLNFVHLTMLSKIQPPNPSILSQFVF